MVEVQEVELQEVHYQDTVETIVVAVVEPTVAVAVVLPTHKMVVDKYKVETVVAVSSL
jgi:hypothetical protein